MLEHNRYGLEKLNRIHYRWISFKILLFAYWVSFRPGISDNELHHLGDVAWFNSWFSVEVVAVKRSCR